MNNLAKISEKKSRAWRFPWERGLRNPPRQSFKALLLATMLLVSFSAIAWVQSGYQFLVVAPESSVSDIPLTTGDWVGEDVEIQDDTVQVLDAHAHINRMYRDSAGRSVSLHAAVWTDPEYGATAPHHPEICYPSAGWEIMQRRESTWGPPSSEVPVELVLFQRGQERVVTAHWYQTGDVRFTHSGAFHAQLFRLWGKQQWDCTEKFLFQTSASSIDRAEPVLRRFVSQLLLMPDGDAADEVGQ